MQAENNTNSEKINQNAALIIQADKSINQEFMPVRSILSFLSIYFMAIPMLFLDISLNLYQFIYFSSLKIPKIRRADYVVVERWKLPKLNFWQRFNCMYCDYANGLMAWAKEVVAQTEIHSCAIKNSTSLLGQQHTDKYYSRELFE